VTVFVSSQQLPHDGHVLAHWRPEVLHSLFAPNIWLCFAFNLLSPHFLYSALCYQAASTDPSDYRRGLCFLPDYHSPPSSMVHNSHHDHPMPSYTVLSNILAHVRCRYPVFLPLPSPFYISISYHPHYPQRPYQHAYIQPKSNPIPYPRPNTHHHCHSHATSLTAIPYTCTCVLVRPLAPELPNRQALATALQYLASPPGCRFLVYPGFRLLQ
jgi:hypothetical protein